MSDIIVKKEIANLYNQDKIWLIDNDNDDYYCYRREEEEFDKILDNNLFYGNLLEIGAGRGRYCLRYAKNFKKAVALDISPEMLGSIRKNSQRLKIDNIGISQCDAENLNIKADSFDIALAPQLIGLCPKPQFVLSEMRRVLKKGGQGIISTPNYFSLVGLKQIKSAFGCFFMGGSFADNLKAYKKEGRNFWLRRQKYVQDSIFSIRKILHKANLEIERISGSGIFPTAISKRLKLIEDKSYLFPIKYFCRTIIVSFRKK